ncbi:MAG: CopG family transcriptional regulator [Dermatophilaceae bacterium]
MATNLRLRPEVAEAVRVAALQSGRSQQEIIREAIDHYLSRHVSETGSELGALIVTGTVRPPRTAYRKPRRRLRLPLGLSSADILDRDDRF